MSSNTDNLTISCDYMKKRKSEAKSKDEQYRKILSEYFVNEIASDFKCVHPYKSCWSFIWDLRKFRENDKLNFTENCYSIKSRYQSGINTQFIIDNLKYIMKLLQKKIY